MEERYEYMICQHVHPYDSSWQCKAQTFFLCARSVSRSIATRCKSYLSYSTF